MEFFKENLLAIFSSIRADLRLVLLESTARAVEPPVRELCAD